jgi:hypothetical protein
MKKVAPIRNNPKIILKIEDLKPEIISHPQTKSPSPVAVYKGKNSAKGGPKHIISKASPRFSSEAKKEQVV